jgi:hypothetical protein
MRRVTAIPCCERCGGYPIGDPYIDDVTRLTDRRVLFELRE